MINKQYIAGFLFIVAFGIHYICWLFIGAQVVFSMLKMQDISHENKESYAWTLFGSAVVILLSMFHLKEKK